MSLECTFYCDAPSDKEAFKLFVAEQYSKCMPFCFNLSCSFSYLFICPSFLKFYEGGEELLALPDTVKEIVGGYLILDCIFQLSCNEIDTRCIHCGIETSITENLCDREWYIPTEPKHGIARFHIGKLCYVCDTMFTINPSITLLDGSVEFMTHS